jgi:hypothetical protein
MKWLMAACAVLALVACNLPRAAAETGQHAARLSRGDAEELMLRADDARRRAFEFPGTATLSGAFGGAALKTLTARSQSFSRRGQRIEERSQARILVFWDSASNEGVLQIAARSRFVSPDQPSQAWVGTLSQWWARLAVIGGTWLVVDDQELAPDRWRPIMPAP